MIDIFLFLSFSFFFFSRFIFLILLSFSLPIIFHPFLRPFSHRVVVYRGVAAEVALAPGVLPELGVEGQAKHELAQRVVTDHLRGNVEYFGHRLAALAVRFLLARTGMQ